MADMIENYHNIDFTKPFNLKQIIADLTEDIESRLISEELERNAWNVTHTARALKISRKGLQLKIAKYFLRVDRPEIVRTPSQSRRVAISNSLRYKILERDKGTCQCCGRNYSNSGVKVHVDHIKPVSKYPELAKEESNLQVLCADCNHAKAARYETNWKLH